MTVTELKNRLSEFLRLVKHGETLEVVERRVPVARIEGIARRGRGEEAQLERLVFEGIVTRARHKPVRKLLDPVPCRADAVRAVIEERGDR